MGHDTPLATDPSSGIWTARGSFRFLQSPLLIEMGLEHGFGDRSLDARKDNTVQVRQVFRDTFGARAVHLLSQVHGRHVIEVPEPAAYPDQTMPEADGFLVRRGHDARCAFLVRTADCLPLIVASKQWAAVLHAGWRGLKEGIVEFAVRRINELEPGARIAAFLGPCACQDAYEVGDEFLDHFPQGSFSRTTGKLYFGLRETTRTQLENFGVNSRLIALSDACSISDKDLFSHRREGAEAGRNVSFVLV